MLGDILPCGKGAYLFCTAGMAEYIETQLHRVRHTEVTCTRADHLPPHLLPQPEDREVIVPSLRLDVLVGAVYNLSRNSADKFFLQQKVFVNGRCIENRAHTVQPGDKISVRGHGRFTAGAPLRRTKKRPAGGAGRRVLNKPIAKGAVPASTAPFFFTLLVPCSRPGRRLGSSPADNKVSFAPVLLHSKRVFGSRTPVGSQSCRPGAQ